MERVWLVGVDRPVAEVAGLREVLLAQRGIRGGGEQSFFVPNYARDIHNPRLMFGMDRAVARIKKAARDKERIVIYGDYDADGISSLAVLVTALNDLGANVSPYLPHRLDDGYGLNLSVLKKLAGETDLLITVDCGISSQAEVAWLNQQGIDVIVTDHHNLPGELPGALAILHPRHPQGNYPFGYLSGVGVAWKLAQALLSDGEAEKWLLDLVCLGTVADMVPLVGENRAIVTFGLRVLQRSARPGLRRLVELARGGSGGLDTETISYRMVPLLNAAGRLDHGQPALELLLTRDERKAEKLLATLEGYNRRRSVRSRQVEREAEEQVGTTEAPILFASSREWEAGVVGLVAGRLCEKYARPVVVVGGGNGHAVGSARAPGGVDVWHLIASQKECLLDFGGHAAAAGFSLAYDRVEVLRRSLVEEALRVRQVVSCREERADAVVERGLISWGAAEMLEQFAPYGEGNKRPVLVSEKMLLADWRAVGKTGEHAKFVFRHDDEPLDGIGFGLAKQEWLGRGRRGGLFDVLFHLDINEFRGRRALQLQVKDIAPAGRVNIVTSN